MTGLRGLALLSASALLFGLGGCAVSFDNPPVREVSGQVVRKDNGKPLPGATVSFLSHRATFRVVGANNLGIDAATTTDRDGRFFVRAKLKSPVDVVVENWQFFQHFSLPAFPSSNRIAGLRWVVSQKKPQPPPKPARPQRVPFHQVNAQSSPGL